MRLLYMLLLVCSDWIVRVPSRVTRRVVVPLSPLNPAPVAPPHTHGKTNECYRQPRFLVIRQK